MKTFTLALLVFGTSIGFADAHHAKHHVPREAWQAAARVPQKTPQSCPGVAGQQPRTNACAEYAPSVQDISQFNDH